VATKKKSQTQSIDGERKFVLHRVDAAFYEVGDLIPRSEWEGRKAIAGEVLVMQRVLMSACLKVDALKRRAPQAGDRVPVALVKTTFRTGKAVDARLTVIKETAKVHRDAYQILTNGKVRIF